MKFPKKQRIAIVGAILFVCGGAFYASRFLTFRVLAHQKVSVTPFTLEQVTVSYRNNPAGEVLERRTTARRADASKAILGYLAGQESVPVRRVDFSDGETISFLDSLRLRMSVLLRSRQLAAEKELLQNPPSNCAFPGEEATGMEPAGGFPAWVIVRSFRDVRLTEWRLPNLQCFPVQMRREKLSHTSEAKLETEVRPLLVAIGEPAPLLFDRSADFEEMAPSELKRALFAHSGVTEATCPLCFDAAKEKAMDEAYYANRPAQ